MRSHNAGDGGTIERYLEGVLPVGLWQEIQGVIHGVPFDFLEEIRLRIERPSSLTVRGENKILSYRCGEEVMERVLSGCCRGSLYAYREYLKEGYLPLPYGMRLGVAGHAVLEKGEVSGVSGVTALSFRIARRVNGVAQGIASAWRKLGRGMLVCAPPGGGKTTFLKDFILQVSTGADALRVAVVDSRGELCPDRKGDLVDVLDGYPRGVGLEVALRTLSPQVIVSDEVGVGDVGAIMEICHCGIPLVASVHGRNSADLVSQPTGRKLLETGAFGLICFIHREGGEFRIQMKEYQR